MLPLPQRRAVLAVQCKKELRPSTFPMLAAKKFSMPRSSQSLVPVLAMPFVSSRLADLCAQYGWSWYDLAGNCSIDVPHAIHLEHSGHGPIHPRTRPKANLSTPEAARVIRALLAPVNAPVHWTQRRMATHFHQTSIPNPSLGLVNKVISHLRDEAFIEDLAGGGFHLRDPIKLLFAWRDAYRFDRHERRNYFTLLQGTHLRAALRNLEAKAGAFAAYAAFSAADFQAPHVRQEKTWIYLKGDYIRDFEQLVEAKSVESGENVVVLIPDDDGVLYHSDPDDGTFTGERIACTNPVQTYVDLFHCGGRGREAAEALLEQKLKPVWQKYQELENRTKHSGR